MGFAATWRAIDPTEGKAEYLWRRNTLYNQTKEFHLHLTFPLTQCLVEASSAKILVKWCLQIGRRATILPCPCARGVSAFLPTRASTLASLSLSCKIRTFLVIASTMWMLSMEKTWNHWVRYYHTSMSIHCDRLFVCVELLKLWFMFVCFWCCRSILWLHTSRQHHCSQQHSCHPFPQRHN